MDSISQVIRAFVQEQFLFYQPDSQLGDDESLLEGGVIDSVGVLALIHFLEERFEISIGDDEVVPGNLDSISQLTAFVRRKTKQAHSDLPPV